MFWQHGPGVWLILLIFLEASTAVEVNRTIDDTLGDSVTGEKPVYLPRTVGVWQDADCKGCILQPDRILAFNGTWTAATYTPALESMSVELAFKGTAIYVFFILANIVEQGSITETACNFTLDGRPVKTFQHTPAPTNEFLFDSLVFSQQNLSNVDHQLSISTSGLNRSVWVTFDYAIYTTDDTPSRPPPSSSPSASIPPTSSTPSSTSTPPTQPKRPSSQLAVIVGSAVGAFVALVVLILVLILLLRHRRRRRAEQDDDEFPTVLSPIHQYNDSNVQFVTPFVHPYMDHSGSEPSQPVTTFPSTTYPEFPGGARGMNAPAFRREKVLPNIPDAAAGSLALAPPVPELGPPQGYTTEAVRRERQSEIGRQVDALQQNMRYLKAVGPFHQRPGGRSGGADMSNLQDEVRVLREQIGYLQEQQQSSWAQGLSDEPPPDYSANYSTVRQ